eukprot:15366903-Ditylum_brightwellii.AAC.1
MFLYQVNHKDCIVLTPNFCTFVQNVHRLWYVSDYGKGPNNVYNSNDTVLTTSNFETLEHLGFLWDTQGGPDKLFVECFCHLKEFKEQNALECIGCVASEKRVQQFLQCIHEDMCNKKEMEIHACVDTLVEHAMCLSVVQQT